MNQQPKFVECKGQTCLAVEFEFGESGVLCDIYGKFNCDGYEPESVVISGTKIEITKLLTLELWKLLEAKMNAELVSWREHCENLRMDAIEIAITD